MLTKQQIINLVEQLSSFRYIFRIEFAFQPQMDLDLIFVLFL